jgi:hypothetical protein
VTLPDEALARTEVRGGIAFHWALMLPEDASKCPSPTRPETSMLPEEDSTVALWAPPERRVEPDDASEMKTSRGRLTVARTDPDETSEWSSRIVKTDDRVAEISGDLGAAR